MRVLLVECRASSVGSVPYRYIARTSTARIPEPPGKCRFLTRVSSCVFVSSPCFETASRSDNEYISREERLAEERAGRAAERMELRELRSRAAGYVRDLKDRSDEVEELTQVEFLMRCLLWRFFDCLLAG